MWTFLLLNTENMNFLATEGTQKKVGNIYDNIKKLQIFSAQQMPNKSGNYVVFLLLKSPHKHGSRKY